VVQQCASAGVGSAFLDGFEELGILFQNVIDGFLNKRRSILTRAAESRRRASFSAERWTSMRFPGATPLVSSNIPTTTGDLGTAPVTPEQPH
jgi:hypothetical protein